MLEDTLTIQAKYSETDQMGFVHHSNYARYYENARWEMFRKYLIPYNEIEKAGFLMPVVKMNARFIKSIKYDEVISINTSITKIPKSTIDFDIIIKDELGSIIHKAEISLAFISSETQKACRPPQIITNLLNKYFLT